MLNQEIAGGLELKRIQRGTLMEGTGGHSWEIGLDSTMNPNPCCHSSELVAKKLELARARGSTWFSPSDKMGTQGPSHGENNRGKGWDVPGAVASAKGCDGEGAPAAPPRGACAGKELIWWEGPCRTELIE